MTVRPLAQRQEDVLRALLTREREVERWQNQAMTGNEIGYALGFSNGMHGDRHTHNGRRMGPAQRVISSLNGLKYRGLVTFGRRRDGLSGTAYYLTEEGRKLATELLDKEEA